MLANIVLILIALFILYFIGLLWLRQSLLGDLRELQHLRDMMMKDYAKRRDRVPLILESIRELEEPSDLWRKLVQDRTETQKQNSILAEKTFEKELFDFLQNSTVRSVNFLAAKQGIEELTTLLVKEEQQLKEATLRFNTKRKEFPYSLASAVFGFHEIEA